MNSRQRVGEGGIEALAPLRHMLASEPPLAGREKGTRREKIGGTECVGILSMAISQRVTLGFNCFLEPGSGA